VPYYETSRCEKINENTIQIINSTLIYYSDQSCTENIKNEPLEIGENCKILNNFTNIGSYKLSTLNSDSQFSPWIMGVLIVVAGILIFELIKFSRKCKTMQYNDPYDDTPIMRD
jgi:hypothetical protein